MARRIPVQRTYGRRSANKSWAATVPTGLTAVAAGTKVLLGGFSLSNSNIDETILRVRGLFTCSTDQNAQSETQVGAFGLILVTDLAAAAGAASIPGPVTDRADDGWFVWQAIVQDFLWGSAVASIMRGVQYPIDSKAKRKVQEGQQVAIMVENSSSTTGFNCGTALRMLSMLS